MSTCRSCGQNILWFTLASGKKHPVDPESVNAKECDDGARLVTEEGEVLTVEAGDDFWGHVSHFSTCPDADKWRKK
jgi:hypothetical protein